MPTTTGRGAMDVRSETTSFDGGVAESDLPIVSKKERFEPGTEPHSPATWQNKLEDPSNARVTIGQTNIGGAFMSSARMGPQGLVRVGFLGEYLQQNDFPVKAAQDIRSAITFAASFQPLPWGEAYIGYAAAANTSNHTSPNLIQALGDLTLGFKASKEWAKGFWGGADVRLLSFSGVGNQSIDKFAVGIRPMLLGTYDFRAIQRKAPFILTLGLGFTFDTTGGLVSQKLNASEEYALMVNKYNRFDLGALLEVPLPFAEPYLEYGFALPMGVSASGLLGPDGKYYSVAATMPQTLGLGVKVTALKDVTLNLGATFGLTPYVGLGVPATAPWNLHFGASFAIDPFQKGEARITEIVREREKKVETKIAEAPQTVRIEGTVIDAETKKPIPGVVIANGATQPSASDQEGKFKTLDFPPAPKLKVLATRDGYQALEQEVPLEPTPGKPTVVQLVMTPEIKKAIFMVSVSGNKKPVKAKVVFKGAKEETVQLTDADTAPKKVELDAGTFTIEVTADGFLAQTRDVQVPPGGNLPVAFELQPAPKKMLVVFKGDKIDILQQVHFATGKADILPDSYGLLQQVVDAIIKNNVKRVRVEGHTDNRGGKEQNQTLSENRARSVADYLVSQGIDRSRLESVGYGDSKPIAPNLTARGRELNRRVEFIVLER
jgi:outer membrane protein OmpA-like peptidoglycan-associated protein